MATTISDRVATSDVAIWSRLMDAGNASFGPEAAREFLQIGFSPQDKDRMRELSERSNDGTLTSQERAEFENYVRVSHFLALMHLKARRRLNAGDDRGQSS